MNYKCRIAFPQRSRHGVLNRRRSGRAERAVNQFFGSKLLRSDEADHPYLQTTCCSAPDFLGAELPRAQSAYVACARVAISFTTSSSPWADMYRQLIIFNVSASFTLERSINGMIPMILATWLRTS